MIYVVEHDEGDYDDRASWVRAVCSTRELAEQWVECLQPCSGTHEHFRLGDVPEPRGRFYYTARARVPTDAWECMNAQQHTKQCCEVVEYELDLPVPVR